MISLYSIKRIVRLISIVIFSVFLVLSAVFLFARYILPFHLPEAPYSLVIADKDGEEIGEILTTDGKRHRSLLKDEIPEFYKKALTDLEDKRFFSHPGFDAIGFGRAMLENIKAGKITQGGSTLSMGLVRNSLWLNDDRTIGKKFLEILYAIRLEGKISKEDILAEYANHVSYGRLSLGLASAAKSYFNKEVRNLTDAESLALITMGKNPSTYDAITEEQNFRKRFTLLADTLEKDGVISSTKKTEILAEKLSFPKPKNPLPYTIDAYKKLVGDKNGEENSGRAIRTTIDKALTQKIEDVANGALSDIAWKNVGDYSVLLIDRDSLEVRVLIG